MNQPINWTTLGLCFLAGAIIGLATLYMTGTLGTIVEGLNREETIICKNTLTGKVVDCPLGVGKNYPRTNDSGGFTVETTGWNATWQP